MRGRIIHYNSNEGRGLISAENKQFPFEIGQWQSETAPALNAIVDFDIDGERLTAVRRVSDEEQLREKAAALGGKLSAFGSAALRGAQGVAGNSDDSHPLHTLLNFGKVPLIAHSVFVFSALFLAFVRVAMVGQGFALVSLTSLPWPIGVSSMGELMAWLAIVSILLPVFWRNRLGWLALLLPFVVSAMTIWNIYNFLTVVVADPACQQPGMNVTRDCMLAAAGTQSKAAIAGMIGWGLGQRVCLASGLVLFVIGIKRFLVPPSR